MYSWFLFCETTFFIFFKDRYFVMKRKRFFAFLLTFVFAFTMCFADVTSAFAYDETEVAEDMSAVEEESVTAAEDDALSEGESANTDAQELDRNVVLLKVSLDGEVKAELTLADLEGIMEAEGSKTYQYSAFNRYVSYKGSELECVKGPTIEGILNSAGIEVEQLSDTGTITFTGFDEISHTFMIGELFADRYYYPNAGNYAGYKAGDAVMEGTDDDAQEVDPLAVEDVRHIAVGTAAEELDELFIRHGDRFALQHDVRQAAEHHHARERGDEGRDLDIRDPEGLPRADQQTDDEHDQHREPHVQIAAHQHGADRTDKADDRADGQVDVADREDAQQHTGGQHEHIGVLGDDIRQVLGQQQLAVGAPGEERRHQYKRDDHRVFLNEVQDLCLCRHCSFSFSAFAGSVERMQAMIFS